MASQKHWSSVSTLCSIFLLLPPGLGHMEMNWPYALRSKFNPNNTYDMIDYSMTSPLESDGSNFPCKGYQNDQPIEPVITYTPGETYNMTLAGTTTHDGGSCQLSLSYDNGGTFRVIKSMIGGCPLKSTWDFTMPSYVPAGNALLAWSWQNKLGNREFYMNCAQVSIESPPPARKQRRDNATSFDELPYIWRANLPGLNNCTTTEGEEPVYPDPGPDVEYGGTVTSESASTPGECDAPEPYGQTYKATNNTNSTNGPISNAASVSYAYQPTDPIQPVDTAQSTDIAQSTSIPQPTVNVPATDIAQPTDTVQPSDLVQPSNVAQPNDIVEAASSIAGAVPGYLEDAISFVESVAGLPYSTIEKRSVASTTPYPESTAAGEYDAYLGPDVNVQARVLDSTTEPFPASTTSPIYSTTTVYADCPDTVTLTIFPSPSSTTTVTAYSSRSTWTHTRSTSWTTRTMRPSSRTTSTLVVSRTYTVTPVKPSPTAPSNRPPYAGSNTNSYLPCVPGTFICMSSTTWQTCNWNNAGSGWIYGYARDVADGMMCLTNLSPYSGATDQYDQQALTPAGYYRDDRIVRDRPDGDCDVDGSILCTDGGQQFDICDHGGWVRMGSVADGTVCEDGRIVES